MMRHPIGSRRALTTLELITSLTSAAVLTVGMGSAVIVSSTALTSSPYEDADIVLPGSEMSLWQEDVASATSITAIDQQTLAITIPDENGDSVDESVVYALDNGTLSRSINSGQPTTIRSNISEFSITGDVYEVTGGGSGPTESEGTRIQSKRVIEISSPATTVSFDVPPGCQEGDVLILALALDGDETASANPSGGTWTSIVREQSYSQVSLYVWSTTVGSSSSGSQSISWTSPRNGVLCILRLSGTSSYALSSYNSNPGYLGVFEFFFLGGPRALDVYSSNPDSMVIQFAAAGSKFLGHHSTGLKNFVSETTAFVPTTGTATVQLSCSHRRVGDDTTDSDDRYFCLSAGAYITAAIAVEADQGGHMMGKHSCRSPKATSRRGLSLVEVSVSTLLVGILLLTSLQTSAFVISHRQLTTDQMHATDLAEDLLSEIMACPYEDREGDDYDEYYASYSTFGPTRGDFDDVDDYHGWVATPPQDTAGNQISGLANWQRSVSVTFVDPVSLAEQSAESTLKKITVTVTDPSGTVTRSVGFAGKPSSPADPSLVSGNQVQSLSIKLVDGSSEITTTIAVRNELITSNSVEQDDTSTSTDDYSSGFDSYDTYDSGDTMSSGDTSTHIPDDTTDTYGTSDTGGASTDMYGSGYDGGSL